MKKTEDLNITAQYFFALSTKRWRKVKPESDRHAVRGLPERENLERQGVYQQVAKKYGNGDKTAKGAPVEMNSRNSKYILLRKK